MRTRRSFSHNWPKTGTSPVFRRICALGLGISLALLLCADSAAVWQQVTSVPGWAPRQGHACTTYDGKFWLFGGRGIGNELNDVWSSSDGVNWTEVLHSAPWNARTDAGCVVFNGKMWIMGGLREGVGRLGDVWWSTEGVHWTQAMAPPPWNSLASNVVLPYDGKMWVAGYTAGHSEVWNSADGTNWIKVADASVWTQRAGRAGAVFDNKMWLMGGYYYHSGQERDVYVNELWYSTDGIAWTEVAGGRWSARANAHPVTYAGNLWVIGGDVWTDSIALRDAWYSPDGISWTQATCCMPWADGYGYQCIVRDGTLWGLGGSGSHAGMNDVWSSTDGTTWTPKTAGVPWDGGRTLAQFGDALWATGGHNSDVWRSVDGLNWNRITDGAPWQARGRHRSVAHAGQLWIVAGMADGAGAPTPMNDVWRSPDGINWIQSTANAPFEPRAPDATLTHNGCLWVLGGTGTTGTLPTILRDVWASPDGARWTQATAAAPWSPRILFGAAVYEGRMWVIGGYSAAFTPPPGDAYADVWSSVDGANWTLVTETAPWGARSGACVLVHDGKLWVIGGYRASHEPLSDSWYSTDGANWTMACSGAPWARRARVWTPIDYAGKMWLYAGNEIWCSSNGLTFDFTELPVGGWKEAGRPLTLTVGAPEGVTYQWYKYGAVIPGATDSTYTIPSPEPDDTGAYSCIVANADDVRQQTPPALIQVFPEGSLPVATIPGLLATVALSLCAGVFLTQRKRKGTFFPE